MRSLTRLKHWVSRYLLSCEIIEGIIEFPGQRMQFVDNGDRNILGLKDVYDIHGDMIGQEMGLLISEDKVSESRSMDVTHYVFEFGESFYYTHIDEIDNLRELTPFKNIGVAFQTINVNWPYLGVHGKYELMNGTRDYEDWCDKAAYLRIKTLGLCEKNTLAGTYKFQKACEKKGIQPILGATYEVERSDGERYQLKFYVEDAEGWRNLLNINKSVIIDNDGDCIDESVLQKYVYGLSVVLMPGKYTFKRVCSFLKKKFDNLYYQIDSVEYEDDPDDHENLLLMQAYIRGEYYKEIPPILISDAYYLDPDDYEIKDLLNQSGSIKGEKISRDQYFKDFEENLCKLELLFREEDLDLFQEIVSMSLKSCKKVAKDCVFQIKKNPNGLPEYKMTPEEKDQYESLNSMFDSLIKEGAKALYKDQRYTKLEIDQRIDKESSVIKKGGFVSYFLILWDVCMWCRSEGILTGVARGSAGGSLVAYLLGIIKINPLEYGLLFERFLNEGRMHGSFPDIDTDFEGARRDEVKRYMEDRYGKNKMASIGTYTTLQIKNAFKEISRAYRAGEPQTLNYMTTVLKDADSWTSIFKIALGNQQLKDFIKRSPEVMQKIALCLNSPKSQSVHPCATVIIPDMYDEEGRELTIFDVLPIRKDDNGQLVTEWEGGEIEAAGYLKEDILGIKQLDKIAMIFRKVEETDGILLNIEDIPRDDKKTFDLFKQGLNKDVFHFGSSGLTGYSRMVGPDSIIDLINMNALFRPGPMGSGAHNKYVNLKSGESIPEFNFGTESITKETFGLMIFQEQIMLICTEIGGFTLVEADDVRKGMGKKKMDILDNYRPKFVEGAMSRGCSEVEAEEMWEKMIAFGAYGFNKSHAAAYSITGYVCNWLKAHYPVQFWITALHFSKNESDIGDYIGEINKLKNLTISPPDINKSETDFIADYENKRIFWTINKIKFIGDASVEAIVSERLDNGEFFSLEEFLERMQVYAVKNNLSPNPVNKRVIENLIIAGAFDLIEDIQEPSDRGGLLEDFYRIRRIKNNTFHTLYGEKSNLLWSNEQKVISGMGESDFKGYLPNTPFAYSSELYVDPEFVFDDENIGKEVLVAGVIREIRPGNPKRNSPAMITLDNNGSLIQMKIWCKMWTGEEKVPGLENLAEDILKSSGRVLFITGKVSKKWGPEEHNTVQSMSYRSETNTAYHIVGL